MNDFMLAILGAAAEFERELISERVKDGMARAKREGKMIGRGRSKRSKDMEKRILQLANQGESIRMIAQKCNIPRSTVHDILSRKRNLNSDVKNDTGIYNQNNLMEEVPLPDKQEEA